MASVFSCCAPDEAEPNSCTCCACCNPETRKKMTGTEVALFVFGMFTAIWGGFATMAIAVIAFFVIIGHGSKCTLLLSASPRRG